MAVAKATLCCPSSSYSSYSSRHRRSVGREDAGMKWRRDPRKRTSSARGQRPRGGATPTEWVSPRMRRLLDLDGRHGHALDRDAWPCMQGTAGVPGTVPVRFVSVLCGGRSFMWGRGTLRLTSRSYLVCRVGRGSSMKMARTTSVSHWLQRCEVCQGCRARQGVVEAVLRRCGGE